MIIVTNNEQRPFSLRNTKIKAFNVNCFLEASVVNTICRSSDVDFTKVVLKIILKRDGKTFTLVNDDFKTLGLSSNLLSMARMAFYQDFQHLILLRTQTASVKGQSLLAFDIDLGGTIDLRGSDELYCEVICSNNLFANTVDLANSFLEIKPVKSTDVERYVPFTTTHIVQAGERRKGFELGDNVTDITILNYDKTSASAPVVNTLTISSKTFDETYSFRDLVASRYINRPDSGMSTTSTIDTLDEFEQCYKLIENVELDGVKLDVQFNASDVTANNNVIVVRSFYTDMKTYVQSLAQTQKSLEDKLSGLKQNADSAVI